MRVRTNGVKMDGTHMQWRPRRSTSYSRSRVAIESSSVSPGDPTMSVHTGNQLCRFSTSSPFRTMWGQSLISNGSAFPAMIWRATRTEPVSTPTGLAKALGAVPLEVFANGFNYMALLESPQILRELTPDMAALGRMNRSGVIVTARGDEVYDFISRYFAPAKGIPEDPVTGAAHCMLAPYWAKRLGKTMFRAFQASRRGGEIVCRLIQDRIELEGTCVFYLEGEVEI